jgi:amidase
MVVDSIAKAASKPPARDDFEGFTWSLYQFGKTITAAQYQLCWANLQGFSRKVAAWQQPYGAWITPVLATLPMKIGTVNFEETDLMKVWASIASYVPFTALQNMTGQPAISLPLAWSKSGFVIVIITAGGDTAIDTAGKLRPFIASVSLTPMFAADAGGAFSGERVNDPRL